jgi:hypothetical protein
MLNRDPSLQHGIDFTERPHEKNAEARMSNYEGISQ